MDRNTLIALLLILLIWLLWPKWMELLYGDRTPSVSEAPADSARVDTTAQPRTALSTADSALADTALLRPRPTVAAPETIAVRRITIETEKYTAVLSNRGAVLRKWRLKDYVTPHGDPVEILPPAGRGMGLLIGETGKERDLTGRLFRVDANENTYTLSGHDSLTVEFTTYLPDGDLVYKRWTFYGDTYTVAFAAGFADPERLDRIVLAWDGEVPPAEGELVNEFGHMRAEAFVGGSVEKIQFKDKPDTSAFTGLTDWVGVRNKYFLAAFAPFYEDPSEVRLFADGVRNTYATYGWHIAPLNVAQRRVRGMLYLGPIDVDLLVQAGHNLERAADLGWTIIRPISKLVLWAFLGMHRVIPNYGWVIIIFSILVKLLVHPLTKKSYESTSKMQQLKPLMDEIREKYKGDPQRMNQEMMKLYKEHGFNPLGGCLPMLLQMPIIFAIYAVIGNNIEFRQAPFIWWIKDLSAPDVVYTLPVSLPIYGHHVSILPILMAASMFIQQKLTITDPKQKAMLYLMPIIMLFIFNRLSSGLVLYWFMFNILSSAHQYYLMRKQRTAETPVPAQAAAPAATHMRHPTRRRRR